MNIREKAALRRAKRRQKSLIQQSQNLAAYLLRQGKDFFQVEPTKLVLPPSYGMCGEPIHPTPLHDPALSNKKRFTLRKMRRELENGRKTTS